VAERSGAQVGATCLINNYNYGRYVCEAVDSALAQTVPFGEIVVVDDGSTDESEAVLRERFGDEPRVRIITKGNEGQLSCFNVGMAASSGDPVFFLDADDAYDPGYLEAALEAYALPERFDFVISAYRKVGEVSEPPPREEPNRDLGFSVVLGYVRKKWVGGPTSCLSMRRHVLEKILPLPSVEEWRTRADDCLVFGSSLAGARKYFLGKPLVRYRFHGSNLYQNRKSDPADDYRRKLAVYRLLNRLAAKFGFDADQLADAAHREFRTLASPTMKQTQDYLSAAWWARAPMNHRIRMCGSILSYYLWESRRRR
jgi:glycosyltransferase involved in cell wall biosynthesis